MGHGTNKKVIGLAFKRRRREEGEKKERRHHNRADTYTSLLSSSVSFLPPLPGAGAAATNKPPAARATTAAAAEAPRSRRTKGIIVPSLLSLALARFVRRMNYSNSLLPPKPSELPLSLHSEMSSCVLAPTGRPSRRASSERRTHVSRLCKTTCLSAGVLSLPFPPLSISR